MKLLGQSFYKELSIDPVNWTLANVGDKIRIESSFSVQTYAVSSNDSPMILNHTDGMIGVGWVYDPQGQFSDFKIGDSILFFNKDDNSHAPFTIIDKLDDSNIQLNTAFTVTPDNFSANNIVFSITNPITGIKYRYNFIENSEAENFFCKVTGNELLFANELVDADNTMAQGLSYLSPAESRIGSATIRGIEIDDGTTDGVYKSKFKVIHNTFLIPLFLSSELNGIGQPTITPTYFANGNCLKFIFGIDALYDYNNPNGVQSAVFSTALGDTGWRNENFNEGNTFYSVTGITYKDAASASIPSIQLSSEKTSIRIDISNTVDAPFTTDTKFVLNIIKTPFSETEYQNTGLIMPRNFLFDRALQQIDEPAVDGDGFGTGYQILTNITGVLDSTSAMHILCDVEMGVDVLANLNASEIPSYRIFVSIQNDLLATKDADLVTLFAEDYQQFYVNTTDPDMIGISNVFLRHPEGDPDTEGVTPSSQGPELLVNGNFNTDLSGWINTFSLATWNLGKARLASEIYSSAAVFTQAITGLTVGKSYTFKWNASSHTIGGFFGKIFAGGNLETVNFSSNGNYEITFTATLTSALLGWGLQNSVPHAYFVDVDGASVTLDEVSFDVFPEDEIVACSKFYIDSNGRENDVVILQNVQSRIIARNTSNNKSFNLDGFIMQTYAYPFQGYAQYMDAQVPRAFHIPAGTIRKYIELKRRPDLDVAGKYYFDLNYPFLFRWEYWTKLPTANSDFFDYAQPNNGLNQWWYHYGSGVAANWEVHLQVIINATKNGVAQQYTLEQKITPHDYASNEAFIEKNIKTYNPDTLADLSTGGNVYFYTDKDTLVKATFEKSEPPTGVTIVLRLEVWEQGGVDGSRRMSSKWPSDSDTWYKSIDNNYKTKLEATGNVVVGSALIDFSVIPKNSIFKITSRIYEIGGVLTTDDGVPITTDDGVQIEID